MTLADRFWPKVAKTEGDGCWEWTASRDSRGYGRFMLNGRSRKAHRIAWALTNGPTDLWVLHHCDNPPCVRPDHMFLGGQSENMLDMYAKGRRVLVPMVGEGHPRHKLTANDVREIRAIGLTVQRKVLAARYGVSPALIRLVRLGHLWKSVA